MVDIYKSKGTEKSIRNVFRCFYLDDKLMRLNVYSNNETYELLEMLNRHVKKDTYLIIEFYKDFSELIEIYQEVDDWLDSKTTA